MSQKRPKDFSEHFFLSCCVKWAAHVSNSLVSRDKKQTLAYQYFKLMPDFAKKLYCDWFELSIYFVIRVLTGNYRCLKIVKNGNWKSYPQAVKF